MEKLGIIAGKGSYSLELAQAALQNGVKEIFCAAFLNETDKNIHTFCKKITWLRVGQLSKMLKFFKKNEVKSVIMAGQITPKNLFELRPDIQAFLLLAKLKERNAESIFGAIAKEMSKIDIKLLPATTFLQKNLAKSGLITGKKPSKKQMQIIPWAFSLAKEINRLDIGQTLVVRQGTVLAVEGFDGTDATLKRGGKLGKGKAIAIKVAKKNQGFRFDIPIIGAKTIKVAVQAKIFLIIVEAQKTLFLEKEKTLQLCRKYGITIFGFKESSSF